MTDNLEKALAGRTIVITRALDQAQEFVDDLEKFGARVLVCPMIEITDPDSYDRLDEAIDHCYGYDWLIFTSVNGVEHFFRRFVSRGQKPDELFQIKVCAIGTATGEKLRDLNVHVDVVPEDFNAEGVFIALQSFVGGKEGLVGKNFLLPRAAVARDYLPAALEAAGARVDVVPAYKTTVPANIDRARLGAMLAGGTDCIAFTSSSTVHNMARLFDTENLSVTLNGVVIACIGDVTATTAQEYGLEVNVQPQQATISSLSRAIADFFCQKDSAGVATESG